MDLTLVALAGIFGLILFGGSILAWVKFWQASGAKNERVETAVSMATNALNSAEGLKADHTNFKAAILADISNFKNQVALEILPKLLEAHEKRIEAMITNLRGDLKDMRKDIGKDITDLHERVDRALETRAKGSGA